MQQLREMQVPSLGQEDSPGEEIATHSSILAWRIPGTEEPGGLQSMGSQQVGQNLSDLVAAGEMSLKWILFMHCLNLIIGASSSSNTLS